MRFKLFFLMLLLMEIAVYAKPILVVDKKVEKYLKENYKQPNSQLVEIDENSNKTFLDLKKLLAENYRVTELKKGVMKIKNPDVKVDLSMVNSDRALCAHEMLKSVMPGGFVEQFRLVSVDLDRAFFPSRGEERIEAYTFNFRRVFNNRVVRNKDNYLSIRVDKNGALKRAVIALQDLVVLDEKIEFEDDFAENKKTLDSLLNGDLNFIKVIDENKQIKKINVNKVEAGSAVPAYCVVQDNSQKILFPCISYASKIKLSNGDKIDYIIDVPHTRKSWEDYHEKNKSARFVHFSR